MTLGIRGTRTNFHSGQRPETLQPREKGDMLLFQRPLGATRFGAPLALSEEEPSRMGPPLPYFHLSLRPLRSLR